VRIKVGILVRVLVVSVLALSLLTGRGITAEKGPILIYSPWKTEVMKEFTDLFTEMTGIKAESINISTGECYARLRVEKDNPQCDVWHSVRAAILADAEKIGLIAPLGDLPNSEYVLEHYRYPEDDHIMGTTMYPLVFCYNTDTIAKMGVAPPENYEDLLDPVWKGEVVAPHPAASGTAYAFVTTVLQLYRQEGETGIESKKGWEYLKKLMGNVAEWTRSGSAPSKLVARGEYPVGISFFDRVYYLAKEGYPIKAVYLSPIYAEPSCTAVVANSPHPEGARAFVNFMLSKEAQELAKKTGNYSVRPDVEPPAGALALAELNIFKDDYLWGAENKKAILGQFSILQWD
jgi:iron(III) transport system substrate-binding protein